MGEFLVEVAFACITLGFLAMLWDAVRYQKEVDHAQFSANPSLPGEGKESSVCGNDLSESEGTSISLECLKDSCTSCKQHQDLEVDKPATGDPTER